MSTSNFQYSAQFLASVERTSTKERLKRYLFATGMDRVRALELYENNVAVPEMLHGLLHGLEVSVRNAMREVFTTQFGTDRWYDRMALPVPPGKKTNYWMDKLQAAKQDAGGPTASAGKVIAEVNFGFWTEITGHHYHWPVWVPNKLARAFPNAKVPRKNIHRRLETIRWLRNRIAHHEPILTAQNRVYAGHQRFLTMPELAECLEWVCADTAAWLKARFRYSQADAILTRVSKMGVTL